MNDSGPNDSGPNASGPDETSSNDSSSNDSGAAAEGVEHLQRAAREVLAAARSFLDAVEHVVEDRHALEDVSATVSGLAASVGEALRGRPAPWVDAATAEDAPAPETPAPASSAPEPPAPGPAGVPDQPVADGSAVGNRPGDDDLTEDWARPLVDADAPRRPSRVRRISVE